MSIGSNGVHILANMSGGKSLTPDSTPFHNYLGNLRTFPVASINLILIIIVTGVNKEPI